MYEVGEHTFVLRATDAKGLYVEQEMTINMQIRMIRHSSADT